MIISMQKGVVDLPTTHGKKKIYAPSHTGIFIMSSPKPKPKSNIIAFSSSAPRKNIESASKKYVEHMKFEFATSAVNNHNLLGDVVKPKKNTKTKNTDKKKNPTPRSC